jgi:hypothetical protein
MSAAVASAPLPRCAEATAASGNLIVADDTMRWRLIGKSSCR